MNSHEIPIEGGGPCDRCKRRSFRAIPNGWRHVDCEPASWHTAQAARRMNRADLSRAARPRRER